MSRDWVEFYPDCGVTLVAKVLFTQCVTVNLSQAQKKMSSDESQFSISYHSSGSEGSREETDKDYDVVCNQHEITW